MEKLFDFFQEWVEVKTLKVDEGGRSLITSQQLDVKLDFARYKIKVMSNLRKTEGEKTGIFLQTSRQSKLWKKLKPSSTTSPYFNYECYSIISFLKYSGFSSNFPVDCCVPLECSNFFFTIIYSSSAVIFCR